jgi:hypothetical protein
VTGACAQSLITRNRYTIGLCETHKQTKQEAKMSMKKIHVEFELDPEVFMKVLQHGSSSMKIAVYGDDKGHKLSKKIKEETKLLPPPKPLRIVALDFMREHKDQVVTTKQIKEHVVTLGWLPNSAYGVINLLLTNKHIKRVGSAQYQITAAGVAYNG